ALAALALSLLPLRRMASPRLRLAAALSVTLFLVWALAGNAFPDAQEAFFDRASDSDDLTARVTDIVAGPARAFGGTALVGYGIGSTHQAVLRIPGGVAGTAPPPAEGELERIVLEIGPLGLALVLAARVLVVCRIWTALAN